MTVQTEIAARIQALVQNYTHAFSLLPEATWSVKPQAEKWSKKEILGHLCDSAQNNLRRLIVTQYQPEDKIVYQQDAWVNIQQYQHMNTSDLIEFWRLLNLQLVTVIGSFTDTSLKLCCDTSLNEKSLVSLEFIIQDYLSHLHHHLRQILPEHNF